MARQALHTAATTRIRVTRAFLPIAALCAVAACGGGDRGAADTRAEAPADPAAGAPAGGPAGAPAGADAGPLTEQSITPQMIALGDSIFHGRAAGGICYTCHGQNAEGSQLAPNLTDAEWLNGDGTLPFIVNIIQNGVAQPVQHPAPMPGFGGALDNEQVRATAAYVYSLSHPNVRAGA